ncbi:hypothetical protein [Amycolatopsis sp. H20-H5]|uniref:hypothetical protein n=1 Tax=Amycolatopsis sp. H20-H5 TaxID=3046309 RepID=UPI002DBDF372|nr:hypothetical protein [Amycolatopsis sp. H20-H5]MEC3974254.1 hypothetical protein [Amycolatopsis sp. H20-H5]
MPTTSALAGHVVPGVDGTTVDFDARRGAPLIVILGNRYTQKSGHQIIESLRSHPATMSVPVVQVACLRDVPKPLQAMAVRHITAGYRGQLADLAARRAAVGAPDVDESTLLTIALDWTGEVTGSFGFSATDRTTVVLVLDHDQRLVARITEPAAFAAIRAALAAASVERTV